MDVLQTIKKDQQIVCAMLDKYISSSIGAIAKVVPQLELKLRQQFFVEQNFIYPEIEGCLKSPEVYFDLWRANQRSIERSLKRLATDIKAPKSKEGVLQNRFATLVDSIKEHFLSQNEVALHAMRKNIPTAEREELTDVYIDVKEQAILKPVRGKKKARRA